MAAKQVGLSFADLVEAILATTLPGHETAKVQRGEIK